VAQIAGGVKLKKPPPKDVQSAVVVPEKGGFMSELESRLFRIAQANGHVVNTPVNVNSGSGSDSEWEAPVAGVHLR
jgi:hypothetical protein